MPTLNLLFPIMSLMRSVSLLSMICGLIFIPAYSQSSTMKRPVTVADSIGMVQLAGEAYGRAGSPEHSPDGKRFTIVVRRGNLEQNTNEYSLLLFNASEAFSSPHPELLLTMSSSSNDPGISKVRWLDEDTISFLGQRSGETRKLYSYTVSARKLQTLISHPRNIFDYDISGQDGTMVFLVEPPLKDLIPDDADRHGVIVSNQTIMDLVAGDNRKKDSGAPKYQFFVKQKGESAQEIITRDTITSSPGVSLSPDGRYAIVQAWLAVAPERWKEYTNAYIQSLFRLKPPEDADITALRSYLLFDVKTGSVEPLLDSPISSIGGFAWGADSKSVIVSGQLLPFNVSDPAERKDRQANAFVVEVKLPNREIVKVTRKPLRILNLDFKTGNLLLKGMGAYSQERPIFIKKGTTWQELDTTGKETSSSRIEVIVEQNLNTPPKLVAVNPRTKQRALLLDLNPQFRNLAFGKVEDVIWTTSDGQRREGGLYLPPDYVPGKKYPLIIQTHGFDPKSFWIDGPATTSFAAQALAGKGFVVIQVDDAKDRMNIWNTPKAAQQDMTAFEGAIDYLDNRGMIDRRRVGLIGWSYTNHLVKYTLTHSKYDFSAAAVADGIDAGYFQYILGANLGGASTLTFDQINGGSPFGSGIQAWLKNSPGFNLHRVKTPVRIEAISSYLLPEWEWFAGLKRLEKPVELVYIPDGVHSLVKPWDRMISQQGNLDWFTFWLKGEEDTDPQKAEQYKRWRKLRELQDASQQTQEKSAGTNSRW